MTPTKAHVWRLKGPGRPGQAAARCGIACRPMTQSQTRADCVFALNVRTVSSYGSETDEVAQRQRRIVIVTLFTVLTAACGAGTSGVTPNSTPSAASSATPAAVASP